MVKKIILNSFFLSFMLLSATADAQVIITEDKDDDVNVVSHEAVDAYEDVANILKLSPLHFMRGKFVLFDQFRLNPKASVELGAGVSFLDYFSAYAIDEDGLILENEYGLGPHLEGSINVHPAGDALLGYYASLNIRYSVSNFTYAGYGIPDIDGEKGYVNDVMFNMTFGYQDTDWTDSFVYDLYGGFGFINRQQTTVGYDLSGTGSVTSNKSLVPAIVLGVKLGMILK